MILDLDLIYAGKIIATTGPKKPQSLLKKYFLMWRKMTILIYKIFILSRKCAKYPDLKKYRGHPKVKAMVKAWRLELKGFETELKELI